MSMVTRTRRHGTPSMYDAGCHEPCCRIPKMRAQEERRLRRLNGPLKVPSFGAIRRLNSLRAGGWPLDKIAAELGVTVDAVDRMRHRGGTGMYVSTHRRVHAVFEALGATPGPSEATRRRALREGHRPPMDWYGLDIDDPKQSPRRDRKTRGVDLDDLQFLLDSGESIERAIERVGSTVRAVERAAYRHGKIELARLVSSVRNHERANA